MNDKQVRNRIYILIGFLCVVLCAFLLRLVQWQLIDGDEYLSHAESTSTYSFSATAARGEIVDCYGRSLATNETVYQIELNQLMMGDTDLNEIIRQLIEILEASGEEWNDTMLISEPDENGHYEFTNEPGNESQEARLAALKDSLGKQQYGTADQVMAVLVEKYGLEDYEPLWQRRIAGVRYQMTLEEFSVRNNFVFATDIGSVTMATIKERSMNLPGVQVIGTSRRNYPDGTILPHILGSVGSITAEQWRVEDEDGNVSYPLRDAGYNMNDLIGQSGLEKVYEEELCGTDGTTEIVVGDGEIQEIRTGVTPTPGKTVMLTINREFQKRVDEALERFMQNEALLMRFLGRLPADPTFGQLCAAMEAGDAQAAFTAAHTLKGLAGNLSLHRLHQAVSRQVELLRSGDAAAAAELMPEIRAAWQAAADAVT